MSPLKNVLAAGDNLLEVFYDFETIQKARYSFRATLHVPNLICIQQFCSRCEDMEGVDRDSVQCGKRKHLFWDDPVGDMLPYL